MSNFVSLSDRSITIQSRFNTLAFVDIGTIDLGGKAQIWQLCIVAVKADSFFGLVPYDYMRNMAALTDYTTQLVSV